MINKIIISLLFIMFVFSIILLLFLIINLKETEKAEAEKKAEKAQAEADKRAAAEDAVIQVKKENEQTVNKMLSGANNGGFDASIDMLHKLSEKGKSRNAAEN